MTTIVKLANKIYDYVKQNKKMPTLFKINNVGYNKNHMIYRLSYALIHQNKDSKGFHIESAKNPIGNKLNVKIYKSDYLDMAKRLCKYIELNKQVPNYVTCKGKKVATDLIIYEFARIVIYYNNKKKLPAYCVFDSAHVRGSTTKKELQALNKKYGRATKSGCDNRGQNTDYYCGCHMAQEIIRNLTNIVVPQDTLAAWMGTTEGGSSHSGIETAFATFNRIYKKNLVLEWKDFSEVGWNGINAILKSNDKDCGIHELYRDTYGHYTNYNTVHDDTIDVQNSLGDYCERGCHCGYVENRGKGEARRYLSGISQKSILIVTRK